MQFVLSSSWAIASIFYCTVSMESIWEGLKTTPVPTLRGVKFTDSNFFDLARVQYLAGDSFQILYSTDEVGWIEHTLHMIVSLSVNQSSCELVHFCLCHYMKHLWNNLWPKLGQGVWGSFAISTYLCPNPNLAGGWTTYSSFFVMWT